jgi:hypothetical protein
MSAAGGRRGGRHRCPSGARRHRYRRRPHQAARRLAGPSAPIGGNDV